MTIALDATQPIPPAPAPPRPPGSTLTARNVSAWFGTHQVLAVPNLNRFPDNPFAGRPG